MTNRRDTLGWSAIAYVGVCAAGAATSLALGACLALLPAVVYFLLFVRWSTIAYPRRVAGVSWLILLATAPPWETNSVTSAGTVSVSSGSDAAKLLVTAAAFGGAMTIRSREFRLSAPTVALLIYAGVALVGAVVGPDLSSSVFRSARLALVIVGVWASSTRLSRRELGLLLVTFASAISGIAVVANAGGLNPLVAGRLSGYVPPLQANDLGTIAAVGALFIVALWTHREIPLKVGVPVGAMLVGVLILTGSRTSLVALILALVVLGASGLRARTISILIAFVAAGTVIVFLQVDTSVKPISAALTRSGTTSATATLSSRTSEWASVAEVSVTFAQRTFGQGLADKTVPVSLPFTPYASVDGTWPSAYLSAGWLGTFVLALAVLTAAWHAFTRKDGYALAVLAFIMTTSAFQDALNDVTIALVLFVSIVITPRKVVA